MTVAWGWIRQRRRALIGDGLLALAAFAGDVVVTLLVPRNMWPAALPEMLAYSAVCALPVLVRRAAPWIAVLGCLAALAAAVLSGTFPMTHVISFIVVTYTTAARLRMRSAVLAAIALWLPVLVVNVAWEPPANAAGPGALFVVLNNVLIALVSFFVGRTVRGRRVSTRALEERARAAEVNQNALAAQAVADERRRIARELHDVVAHHVSVIGVLATGARRVLRRDPDGADGALHTIEETSRTTLREMRRLLDVLRTDAEEPDDQLSPQPGLAGIRTLVEQVRDAGLPVRLHVEGDPVPLDPGVGLTVYRIVQEALTNTLKHAGQATATVRLRFDAEALTVDVSDTGRGPVPHAGAGIGHGVVGMRERVALYGGKLRTGPRAGGGFAVQAVIPADQLSARG